MSARQSGCSSTCYRRSPELIHTRTRVRPPLAVPPGRCYRFCVFPGRFRRVQKPLLLVACAAGLACSPARCVAQGETSPRLSAPVLQTGTRLVVEDVLVTDMKGDPVRGLPQSAFHVFDREKPQAVKSFEEGSPAVADPQASPSLPPGVFSNSSYLYSSSLVSDVFLIDADAIPVESQMFLLQQFQKSIDALPAGVQASIFCATSGRLLQVRGFTAGREDLKSGVAECIPRLPTAVADSFVSGVQQLQRVAAILQPLPGRKSVLWFSGPFPLVPLVNEVQGGGSSADFAARTEAFHQMETLLSEARISVFPMDPRGVILAPAWSDRLQEQYGYEQQLAEATGGTSSHLNNLEQQIDRAVSLGREAYTLSYSPADYQSDGSWHAVRVAVDGPYRISYRQGYSATWAGSSAAETRRLLSAGKGNAPVSHAASTGDKPLIFTVQMEKPEASDGGTAQPAPPVHPNDPVISVAVRIPVSQLGFTHNGGQWRSSATVAAYAYDEVGKLKGGEQQELDSSLSEGQWQTAQTQQVSTHQTFAVPRSAKYIVFVVSDKASQRQGTLLVPAQAFRPNL